MIIFPAIDIKDGKCVRLKQGDFKETTIYNEDPIEVSKEWEGKGAKYIHLVDLDGALSGMPKNIKIIEEIIKNIHIPIQIGGGIRNEGCVQILLEKGVSRIILGSAALKNKELLKELVKNYTDKIAVSVDAKNGFVAVDGWTKISNIKSIDFVKELEEIGVKTIVYTDIAKDGMMQGPNFEIYEILKNNIRVDIIASGGIRTLEDILKIKEMGLYGCIVGKALYNKNISMEEIAKL